MRAPVLGTGSRPARTTGVSPGKPGGAPAHGFVDVPGWLANSVNWADHHNLMSGYPGNLFKPNANITRGQVANVD